MKWLLILASLFFKPLSRLGHGSVNPVDEIKDFFIQNAKKVLGALIVTSIISSTFVAGLVITVITISAQYDQNAGIGLSAMLLGGIAMMLVSLIGSWVVLSPSREIRQAEKRAAAMEREMSAEGNSFSDALVLLINDFVKEREFKRAQASDINLSTAKNEETVNNRPEDIDRRH